MNDLIFDRSRLLLGTGAMDRLAALRVLVMGVGGVGSWCAEALVRTGVGHVTLVDADRVAVTNINRQLMATTATVDRVKVDALREHLLLVNPRADIRAVQALYTAQTAGDFDLDAYDYVVDCIDSLKDKALLIENTCRFRHARLYSSMGAALKLDPTRVAVAEFGTVRGCPLARALRQHFKRRGTWPRRKFKCVYSDELLANRGTTVDQGGRTAHLGGDSTSRVNGSVMHITAMFGLTLAGLVIQDATKNIQ